MKDEKKKPNPKKINFFQTTCIILIALLLIAVVIEIIVIIDLKNKTDNLKDKLDSLPETRSFAYEKYEISQHPNFTYENETLTFLINKSN